VPAADGGPAQAYEVVVPQGQSRLLRLRFAALLSAMRHEDFCEGCNLAVTGLPAFPASHVCGVSGWVMRSGARNPTHPDDKREKGPHLWEPFREVCAVEPLSGYNLHHKYTHTSPGPMQVRRGLL
jgi:hypothetical protein